MKKLIAALALSVAAAAPALAGNVGLSIRIGEPGFYGQIDIGGYGRPSLVYSEPVVLSPRYRSYAPIYIRAPHKHYRNWSSYCARYGACARPVYFVRDEWYSNVYVPRYRQHYYANDWRHDGYDNRWNERRERRDWRDERRYERRYEYDRYDNRYERNHHDGRKNDRRDNRRKDRRHDDDRRDEHRTWSAPR